MASGSIRRRLRKDGVAYEAVVSLPPDPLTGKPRQKAKSFGTRREAQRQLTAWKSEMDSGTWVDNNTKTVSDLLLYWLENEAKHRVRPSTYASYKQILMHHLIPGLGAVQAQKLTAAQLQKWYTDKLSEGASVRTVRFCHLHLGQAFGMAVRMGLLARDVTDAVSPPRSQRKEMTIWSPEETRKFLSVALSSSYGPIWLLLAGTGMRRGEALGLRWRDIDWERSLIYVRQAIVAIEGRVTVTAPKRAASERGIPVPAPLIESLKQHRAQQNERRLALGYQWQDCDLVFPSNRGTPVSPSNLAREFYRLREEAGVPPLRIHDIRHAVASHLIERGVDVKAVSEHLGHANVAITVGLYQHISDSQRRGVADAISSVILGKT